MPTETMPMKRSCPSVSSVRWRNPSRHTRGAANGSSPSRISSSASAVHSESGTRSLRVQKTATRLLRGRAWRRVARAGLLEVLEEIGTRVEHHQIALVAECRLVRFQAAIERVELGILAVRLRVDRRRFRIAVALDLLRLTVCVGEDHLP